MARLHDPSTGRFVESPFEQCAIADCAKQVVARGWCMAHYLRWHRFGDPLGSGAQTIEQRLWAKVEKTESCWLFRGGLINTGYGVIGLGGRQAGKILAHRLAYTLAKGPIPEGLELDHLCHTPACVNPDHLEAVTHSENLSRRRAYKHSK